MKPKLPWAQAIESCPLNNTASKLELLTVTPSKNMTRLGKSKYVICSSADLNDILQSCYPLRAKSDPVFLTEPEDTIGALIGGILAYCVNGCKTDSVRRRNRPVRRDMFYGHKTCRARLGDENKTEI